MADGSTTLHAALDQARAIERRERDEQSHAEFDRVDRLGAALQERGARRT